MSALKSGAGEIPGTSRKLGILKVPQNRKREKKRKGLIYTHVCMHVGRRHTRAHARTRTHTHTDTHRGKTCYNMSIFIKYIDFALDINLDQLLLYFKIYHHEQNSVTSIQLFIVMHHFKTGW